MYSRYARRVRPALLGAAAAALALVVSTASGAKPGSPFRLGRSNSINKTTALTGKTKGPQLKLANKKAGSTALDLKVPAGQAPLTVNSSGKVANLNADQLDGLDSTGFLRATGTATDSSKLEGHASSYFLPATGTAADSIKLGGHPISDFYLLGDAFSLTTNADTALSATSTSPGPIVGVGVKGVSDHGWGVLGSTLDSRGVVGLALSDGVGVLGEHFSGAGVLPAVAGLNSSNEASAAGVLGVEEGSATGFDRYGVRGTGPTGVYGKSNATDGNGVVGESNDGTGAYGVEGKSTSGYAGYFIGNVNVSGTLSKTAGSFRIDHPLDPAHKYLQHSFVESPDMMDVYNGNVTTDDQGYATVPLPRWFQALNKDFRYQLTTIGQFAQAIVDQEIANNHFTIQTDKPNVKVSWQVTGIRHDPYANDHRIQVEVRKPRAEQGTYVYPQGYGKPRSLEVGEKTPSR